MAAEIRQISTLAKCDCKKCRKPSWLSSEQDDKRTRQEQPYLVVDQVMQSKDRTDEGSHVDDQHHVIGLDSKGAVQFCVYVGEQIKYILQTKNDSEPQGISNSWLPSYHAVPYLLVTLDGHSG